MIGLCEVNLINTSQDLILAFEVGNSQSLKENLIKKRRLEILLWLIASSTEQRLESQDYREPVCISFISQAPLFFRLKFSCKLSESFANFPLTFSLGLLSGVLL